MVFEMDDAVFEIEDRDLELEQMETDKLGQFLVVNSDAAGDGTDDES